MPKHSIVALALLTSWWPSQASAWDVLKQDIVEGTPIQIKQGGWCVYYHEQLEQFALTGCQELNAAQLFQWVNCEGFGHQLVHRGSRKCVTVPDVENGARRKLLLEHCSCARAQKWDHYPGASDGSIRFKWAGGNLKMCMDYHKNIVQEGYILIWECHEGGNQLFQYEYAPLPEIPNNTLIQLHHGGWCVYYHEQLDQLALTGCNETIPAQQFQWVDCDGFGHQLVNIGAGLCATVPDVKNGARRKLLMEFCNCTDAQMWMFDPVASNGHGLFKWVGERGMCMDYHKNVFQEGYILIWECHGGGNQVFQYAAVKNSSLAPEFSVAQGKWSVLVWVHTISPPVGAGAFSGMAFVLAVAVLQLIRRKRNGNGECRADSEVVLSEMEEKLVL